MPTFDPTHASSRAIVRPVCPRCGAMMMLSRIEPDSPGHDKRIFECPVCNHSKSEVVKF
jgi:transposase-like protein